jgi:hypothetical protein
MTSQKRQLKFKWRNLQEFSKEKEHSTLEMTFCFFFFQEGLSICRKLIISICLSELLDAERLDQVTLTCNPSYSGGGDQEDQLSRPAQTKI